MEPELPQNDVAPAYRGVRKRKWGKWVSEIREPGKKTRIWLGSYDEPEMAAAAYDVASLHLRGRGAHLNFPDLILSLPRPASSAPEDVQLAAQEAATWIRNRLVGPGSGGFRGCGGAEVAPVTVGLSASEIQAINDSPLDSPTGFRDWSGVLVDTMILSDEEHCGHVHDYDDYGYSYNYNYSYQLSEDTYSHDHSIWDY